ncbi:hypothetical protein AVEN_141964-1 [Araneus ventricosus]|uniref:Uncharacterized protein n=1 Tax=Araneus ventricosus TaxID=182803 RepID=A0A4Y2EA95_ARAVE|nr:hypothetical protein AVEN_141964-1 [Araneus ventricosus]
MTQTMEDEKMDERKKSSSSPASEGRILVDTCELYQPIRPAAAASNVCVAVPYFLKKLMDAARVQPSPISPGRCHRGPGKRISKNTAENNDFVSQFQ